MLLTIGKIKKCYISEDNYYGSTKNYRLITQSKTSSAISSAEARKILAYIIQTRLYLYSTRKVIC